MGNRFFAKYNSIRGWTTVESIEQSSNDIFCEYTKGYKIKRTPIMRPLYVPCRKCNAQIIDDGIKNKAICENCGEHIDDSIRESYSKRCCIFHVYNSLFSYGLQECQVVDIAINKDIEFDKGKVIPLVMAFFSNKLRYVSQYAMFSIGEIEFRIMNIKPHANYVKVTNNTLIRINDIFSSHVPIKYVLLVTSSNYSNTPLENIKRDIYSTPHKNELIIIKNKSAKINNYNFYIKNSFPECGIITNETAITIENKEISIIKSLTIYQISEVPQTSRNIAEIEENYLFPYFYSGTSHFIERGDILTISNKEFFIVDTKPRSGFVSNKTEIIIKGGETREDCISMMTKDDNKIAREMNKTIRNENRISSSRSTRDMYIRLNQMVADAIVNSRPFRLRVLSEYVLNREDIINENEDDIELFTGEQRLGTSLPVFTVDEKYVDIINKAEEDYVKKCVICMEKFELGNKIKTLPCCKNKILLLIFLVHVFHVECVDAWLCQHYNCPICKHRIDETNNV